MPPAGPEGKTWTRNIIALFILRSIQREPAHGNLIAVEIKRLTGQTMEPNPNFLYPLLRSMEEAGYVNGSWDSQTKRGKKVYTITPKGNAHLETLRARLREHFMRMEKTREAIRRILFEEDTDNRNSLLAE